MARFLICAGIILILLGLAIHFFPRFGQLPGDISIERPNGKILIPLTSMIIISVILTFLVNLALWIISKIK